MRKLTALAAATLGLAVILSGCNGGKSKEEKAEAKQLAEQFKDYKIQKDAKGKTWDFGGMKIILGDFWSPITGSMSNAAHTPAEEDEQKFHKFIMNTYNVDIDRYGVSGWDTHPQTVSNFCTTGGDENYMFEVDGRSLAVGIQNDLFWDLSEFSDIINWNDPKWNKSVFDLSSKGKSFYACRAMPSEPRQGLFFNKRLIREAGLDPEEIYDLQRDGKWDWEAFERFLRATTRDIDNDGILDIYGMANVQDFCYLAAQSNGTNFIEKDANGKFVSHIGDDSVMEAMAWTQRLVRAYQKPQPEGAAWDWAYACFKNAETAFVCHALYFGKEIADATTDDYGFVAFPYGPKSNKVNKTLYNDNIFVLPKCYDKDRAAKILKAFDLWSDIVPGYTSDDTFLSNQYPLFRDSRSVDETIKNMLVNGEANLIYYVPGINQLGDFIWNVYPGYVTPQEAYETTKNPYQALLDEINN